MSNETPAEVLAEIAERYSGNEHLMHYHARLSRSLAAGKVVPDGYVLMPRKMTIEMSIAFAETWFSRKRAIDDDDMQDAYDALIESAPPADPAKASEPEYDRSLIADMLTAYHSGANDLYTIGAIMEQIRLLRAADNADAAKVRTVRGSGSAPDELLRWVNAQADDPNANERFRELRGYLATPPASAPEVTGKVNGYLPRQRAIEIKLDGEVPEWMTTVPPPAVTITAALQEPRHD